MEKPLDPDKLMATIKDFRDALGITQVELATKMGKSYSSIQRYETKEPPGTVDLARLALLARQANKPEFARIFKAEALRDVAGELIQLIREKSDEDSKKAPTESPVHKRRTGT